jgi:GTP cyclohydrolase II
MFTESAVSHDASAVVDRVRDRLRQANLSGSRSLGPFVTLTYAQSLDGSIATEPGKSLQLSNPQSQALTHQLRAMHDAILIGVNTVFSDDPRLTVRLAAGRSPLPIVLDSQLRFPLAARLLRAPCVAPIIVTAADACPAREGALREAGAQVIRLPTLDNGHIEIRSLLVHLRDLGIRSLMVEGGGRVITSFLSSRAVELLIVTIVPQLVGGFAALQTSPPGMSLAVRHGLTNVRYDSLAGDLVVSADLYVPPLNPKNVAQLSVTTCR